MEIIEILESHDEGLTNEGEIEKDAVIIPIGKKNDKYYIYAVSLKIPPNLYYKDLINLKIKVQVRTAHPSAQVTVVKLSETSITDIFERTWHEVWSTITEKEFGIYGDSLSFAQSTGLKTFYLNANALENLRAAVDFANLTGDYVYWTLGFRLDEDDPTFYIELEDASAFVFSNADEQVMSNSDLKVKTLGADNPAVFLNIDKPQKMGERIFCTPILKFSEIKKVIQSIISCSDLIIPIRAFVENFSVSISHFKTCAKKTTEALQLDIERVFKIWKKITKYLSFTVTSLIYEHFPLADSFQITEDTIKPTPIKRLNETIYTTFIRVIDDVIASWHIDEEAGGIIEDTSGQGNTGNIHGATSVDGKFEKALDFDGGNDYVDCGNGTSLDITDAITIEMWVKPNTVSGSSGYLISKNNLNVSDHQYAIYTTGGSAKYYSTGSPSTPGGVIPYNVWTYVIFTRTSGGIGQFYINGTASGDPVACNMPSKTFPVRLGCRWNQGTTPHLCFNGIIDEVKIYNQALTAEEITDIYNNYGYTTLNYPGKVLVREYVSPESAFFDIAKKSTIKVKISEVFQSAISILAYEALKLAESFNSGIDITKKSFNKFLQAIIDITSQPINLSKATIFAHFEEAIASAIDIKSDILRCFNENFSISIDDTKFFFERKISEIILTIEESLKKVAILVTTEEFSLEETLKKSILKILSVAIGTSISVIKNINLILSEKVTSLLLFSQYEFAKFEETFHVLENLAKTTIKINIENFSIVCTIGRVWTRKLIENINLTFSNKKTFFTTKIGNLAINIDKKIKIRELLGRIKISSKTRNLILKRKLPDKKIKLRIDKRKIELNK